MGATYGGGTYSWPTLHWPTNPLTYRPADLPTHRPTWHTDLPDMLTYQPTDLPTHWPTWPTGSPDPLTYCLHTLHCTFRFAAFFHCDYNEQICIYRPLVGLSFSQFRSNEAHKMRRNSKSWISRFEISFCSRLLFLHAGEGSCMFLSNKMR